MADMPQWLTQPENYEPPTDKDRFIDKSIVSFIGLISKIKQQSGRESDLLWVSPVFKLLFTILYIVLVSSSRHFTLVYVMLAYIVLVLAIMPAGDIRKSLKGALIAAAFTYIILWVLVPEAKTASDKLSMRGEPTTVSNIASLVEAELTDLGNKINKWSKDFTNKN